jgi:hypothetical protein
LFRQLAHKATESVRHEDIDMLSVCNWARLNESIVPGRHFELPYQSQYD